MLGPGIEAVGSSCAAQPLVDVGKARKACAEV